MYAFGPTLPPPSLQMSFIYGPLWIHHGSHIPMSEIILLVRGKVKKGEAKKVTKGDLRILRPELKNHSNWLDSQIIIQIKFLSFVFSQKPVCLSNYDLQ